MRKAIAIGVACCCYASVSVRAADINDSTLPDPLVAYGPSHSWAGLYVGGSAGFGKGKVTDAFMAEEVSHLFTEHVTLHSSDDLGGPIYGVHLGYNWQLGHVVAGLEASLNGTGLDGSADYGSYFSVKTDLNWYSAAVARLGYADGAWLFYGFGGVAWGRGDVALRGDKPNGIYSDGGFHGFDPTITEVSLRDAGSDHVGWTAGMGVEFAVNDRWSVRAEYSHVDLGDDTVSSGSINSSSSILYYYNSFANRVDLDFDVVKIGASYKLFGPEPATESLK